MLIRFTSYIFLLRVSDYKKKIDARRAEIVVKAKPLSDSVVASVVTVVVVVVSLVSGWTVATIGGAVASGNDFSAASGNFFSAPSALPKSLASDADAAEIN